MKKLLKLSSFWLRIIALITMTFDHVGVLLDFRKFYYFRIIGRISLPLFIFLAVQGALKTRNKKNYAIRLLILLVITSAALIVLPFLSNSLKQVAYSSGNIFFDLLFSVLCVWILDSDNKKIKPLIALPIAYSIFSFVVVKLEGCACNGYYDWFPACLRMQYSIYAILLSIGFYYSSRFSERYENELDDESAQKKQLVSNLLSIATIVLVTALMIGVNYIFGDKYTTIIDAIQSYAIISGVFVLFYNGRRGYNAKWFRILSYAYYPLHLLVIALFCLV